MAKTDNSFLEPNAPSLGSRFAWLALMLAALYLSYFHNLGALGLVGPDEPRYAWIARDMMETGDWVTPRLYGKPWFEKPVLYYWGAALSFKLFGVNEAAARLPSAASALLATLALAWLARRLYGAATAGWLMLFLPTTVGMIGFSHAAATDMPFSAMLTMAMVSAAFVLGLARDEHTPILPRTPWLALVFLGFFLGLAVLAKGPAAIVLSGGALLLWAISTKQWRDTVRCLHPVALTSFCLTALPWYVLCARRNPEFFRVFIIEHNFKRYVTPEFQHIQPFWFYLPVTLLAMFPWTILLIPASERALAALRGRHPESRSTLFFLCWVAFPVVFFSASRSKLPGYILPAIPPLALLLAASLPARLRPAEKPAGWLVAGLGAGLPVLAIALSAFSRKWPASSDILPSSDVRFLGFTVAFAGLTVVVLALLGRDRAALFALVFFVLVLILKTGDLLGRFDPALTARSALFEARRTWPEFSPSDAATWGLARSEGYQLNFYAHAVLPEWQPGEPAPGWLFLKPTARTEAVGSSFACLGDRAYRAVIPCRYSGSAGGLAVFRGGRDHRVRDGQPR